MAVGRGGTAAMLEGEGFDVRGALSVSRIRKSECFGAWSMDLAVFCVEIDLLGIQLQSHFIV